jgi:hypothetical protein
MRNAARETDQAATRLFRLVKVFASGQIGGIPHPVSRIPHPASRIKPHIPLICKNPYLHVKIAYYNDKYRIA